MKYLTLIIMELNILMINSTNLLFIPQFPPRQAPARELGDHVTQ